MKKILVKVFQLLVAIAISYLFYMAFKLGLIGLAQLFEGVNDTVKAASISAFVAVILFLIGRYFEQGRERKLKVNAEKITVYKRFFDFYFDMMTYEKLHGSPKDSKEVLKELIEFQKDLVFWGSDQVLHSYLNFKDDLSSFTYSRNSTTPDDGLHKNLAMVMKSVAALLVAMRKDIGYSFTVFNARDLARLQLSTDDDTKKIFEFL